MTSVDKPIPWHPTLIGLSIAALLLLLVIFELTRGSRLPGDDTDGPTIDEDEAWWL